MAASERAARAKCCGRESRDLGECEGAVETWDATGERESAKCGRESRPGCKDPSKCENILETWMQRAKRVRKSTRDLDAKSKRVRKSARDLYVETWMDQV